MNEAKDVLRISWNDTSGNLCLWCGIPLYWRPVLTLGIIGFLFKLAVMVIENGYCSRWLSHPRRHSCPAALTSSPV